MTPPREPTTRKYETREAWLNAAVDLLRVHFKSHGKYTVPAKVRVSCSWPSHRPRKAIGQAFTSEASGDGHFEIMISPVLGTGLLAIDTLVHELVHATVGIKAGHKGPFKKCALAVGLVGKMRSAGMSPQLEAELTEMCKQLGRYPHASLALDGDGEKKQGTRMIKIVCTDGDCGYTLRTTQKWIDVGLPTCTCGSEMEIEE